MVVLNADDAECLLGSSLMSGTIGVTRNPREMARVRGTSGDIQRKFRDSDFSRLGFPF